MGSTPKTPIMKSSPHYNFIVLVFIILLASGWFTTTYGDCNQDTYAATVNASLRQANDNSYHSIPWATSNCNDNYYGGYYGGYGGGGYYNGSSYGGGGYYSNGNYSVGGYYSSGNGCYPRTVSIGGGYYGNNGYSQVGFYGSTFNRHQSVAAYGNFGNNNGSFGFDYFRRK